MINYLKRFLLIARFAFVVAFGLVMASQNGAAAPTLEGIAVTSTGKPRHWKSLPISLCKTDSLPSSAVKALEQAAGTWNRELGKPVFTLNCKAKTGTFERENADEHSVFWVRKNFEKTGDPLALARTLSSYDEDSGEMVDADILINAQNFDWRNIRADLKSILIHELGHVLGLQHLFTSTVSVMNQYPYQSGIVRHRLGDYEVRAIKKQYFSGNEPVSPATDAYFGKDYQKSIALLRTEIPRDAENYYAEGIEQLALKEHGKAIDAFTKSLELNPKNEQALYHLAESHILAGDSKRAKAVLEQLIAQSPNYYEALADLGLIEMQQGRKKEAKALFEQSLKLNPVHYAACYFLFELTHETRYDRCFKRFTPKE